MTTPFARLSLAVAAGTTGLLLAAPAQATPDTNCDDYPTRAAAQAAFDAAGGSPTNNWHGLDNDHDGKVCEHHRYPGQPTPPPNPGPSGCAVCSPSPSPSVTVSFSPAPSTSAEPPVVGNPGPGDGAEPTEPVPTLPVTGPANTALGIIGGSMLAIGIIGILVSRRRRDT